MKHALVTGAAARLGRAMALHLAGRGYAVAVHYSTSKDAADTLVDEIAAAGGRGVALGADFLDEDAIQSLFPAACEALGGPITCLVNNASIFEPDDLYSSTRESWDRAMESNLRAPFVLTQGMAAQGLRAEPDATGEPRAAGLIVNMIDQRVLKPTPAFASYTLAKMALWALTRTSAQALAPHIRVNGIGPGPTLRATRQSTDHFGKQRASLLLERGSNPEDITAALGYLLDAPAVTGQLFCVDGGQHLAWETPDVTIPE